MKKTALIILAGLMLFTFGCSSDEAKDAAEKTKEAFSATKLAANKALEDAKKMTKEAADKAVEATKETAQEMKEKAVEVSEQAAEATKEAAKEVKEKAAEVTEQAATATKEVAEEVEKIDMNGALLSETVGERRMPDMFQHVSYQVLFI